MKFHLQTPNAHVVTGCGNGWVRVGVDEYRSGVILTPDRVVTGWAPAGFDALTVDDFARLLESSPEIVLLGTGAVQRFPHPRLLKTLFDAQVGVEWMDRHASC